MPNSTDDNLDTLDMVELDFDFPDLDLDSDLATLNLGDDDNDVPQRGAGDIEGECKTQLQVIATGIAKRSHDEQARRRKATDSEYWFCVCFQTRAEVEAFLKATKWAPPGAKYIDGRIIARKMNVSIPVDDTPFGSVRIDRRYADLVGD
jgi:hypothetical protein